MSLASLSCSLLFCLLVLTPATTLRYTAQVLDFQGKEILYFVSNTLNQPTNNAAWRQDLAFFLSLG
jgi:hypothetical protein